MNFPEADQATTNYPIAVLKNAPQPQLAQQFEDLVTGDAGSRRSRRPGSAREGPGRSGRSRCTRTKPLRARGAEP